MTRNTERRVEVGVRIHDKRIAGELLEMLDFQLHDTVNAREMQPDGSYQKVKPAQDAPRVDSQLGMYDRLADAWPELPAERPAAARAPRHVQTAKHRTPQEVQRRRRRPGAPALHALSGLKSLLRKK